MEMKVKTKKYVRIKLLCPDKFIYLIQNEWKQKTLILCGFINVNS